MSSLPHLTDISRDHERHCINDIGHEEEIKSGGYID
jgi:hypothetical protein